MLARWHVLQEADACGARIEYMDQEQSVTVRRISESFKFTVRVPTLQASGKGFQYACLQLNALTRPQSSSLRESPWS